MKRLIKIIRILPLLGLLACGDGKQPLPSIEGRWEPLFFVKQWTYDFNNGLLTQSASGFGTVITVLQYPYAERGDTVIIGGDLNNAPRRWVLHFECADVVHVQELDQPFSLVQYLKRIE